MHRPSVLRFAIAVCVLAACAFGGQDLPGKLTGTWTLNRELTPGVGAPGRGRSGGGAVAQRASYTLASFVPQRRGGGGGGQGGDGISDATDLTPEQRAARAAMSQLQQIGDKITIKAAADAVTFVDARGEHAYTVNDKTTTVDVAGSPIKVKAKWDKQSLKQEFSSPESKLTETWSVDGTDHVVLIVKLESLTLNGERKIIFDRTKP